MILQENFTKQARFIRQGSRYMNGGAKICQWYVDAETDKLYKLTIEETNIEEALSLERNKENEA